MTFAQTVLAYRQERLSRLECQRICDEIAAEYGYDAKAARLALSTVTLKVESDAISAAQYNAKTGELDVTFTKGARQYRYFGVSPDMVEAFCAAPSKGAFINKTLKPACLEYRLQ